MIDAWLAFARVEPEAFQENVARGKRSKRRRPGVHMMGHDEAAEFFAKKYG